MGTQINKSERNNMYAKSVGAGTAGIERAHIETPAVETDAKSVAAGSEGIETSTKGYVTALVGIASFGAACSVALGMYGQIHQPTGESIATFGFSAVLPMKAWLTSAAALLGVVQGLTALWMYGRLPVAVSAPRAAGLFHRWLGTVAFIVTLPVAYHCLWALGFEQTNGRMLAHSILGCVFYGVFVSKMLALRSDRLPAWAVPLAGGVLLATLVGLWWTSAWWFFTNFTQPTY